MDGYYGNPPPAPDIRAQRPSYFYRQPERRIGFAMPEGQQPYMPAEHPWQVPDLWPEIEQDIRGILQQRQEYPVTLPEEGPERQRMMMAWQSPQGLAAIETGEYRKFEQKEKQQDRALNRISKLESLILQAHKADAPQGLIAQVERRYNSSIDAYEKLTGEDSGYPRYTGEGKGKLKELEAEKGPGFFQSLLERFKPQPRQAVRRPIAPRAEAVEAAPAEVAFGPQTYMRDLIEAERQIRSQMPEEEADRVIQQITQSTKDPGERLRKAQVAAGGEVTAKKPTGEADLSVYERYRQAIARGRGRYPYSQR